MVEDQEGGTSDASKSHNRHSGNATTTTLLWYVIGIQLNRDEWKSTTSNVERRTFPGLKRFSGSIACFIVFISRTVPAPNSSTRNSLLP